MNIAPIAPTEHSTHIQREKHSLQRYSPNMQIIRHMIPREHSAELHSRAPICREKSRSHICRQKSIVLPRAEQSRVQITYLQIEDHCYSDSRAPIYREHSIDLQRPEHWSAQSKTMICKEQSTDLQRLQSTVMQRETSTDLRRFTKQINAESRVLICIVRLESIVCQSVLSAAGDGCKAPEAALITLSSFQHNLLNGNPQTF